MAGDAARHQSKEKGMHKSGEREHARSDQETELDAAVLRVLDEEGDDLDSEEIISRCKAHGTPQDIRQAIARLGGDGAIRTALAWDGSGARSVVRRLR